MSLSTSWLVALLLIFAVSAHTQNPQEIFAEGNKAFTEENYELAIKSYSELESQGLKSTELYLNMGNAYFRKENLASAILSYERGLRLAPNDEGILANLNLANDQLASEIIEVPPFVLVRWWRTFANLFSTAIWAVIQLLLSAGLAFIVSRFFLQKDGADKSKTVRATMILLPFILLSFLAGQTKENTNKSEHAIVMENVELKDAPDERSELISEMYSGNKVLIVDQIGDWYKVLLANQSIGWLPADSIEKI